MNDGIYDRHNTEENGWHDEVWVHGDNLYILQKYDIYYYEKTIESLIVLSKLQCS